MVDFPDPFGPRKPWTSPVRTVRSSPSSALTLPKVFTTPVTSMAGGDQTPPAAAGVDLDAGVVAAELFWPAGFGAALS